MASDDGGSTPPSHPGGFPQNMSIVRRLLLVAALAVWLTPCARGTGTVADVGNLMITLEHHWVVEISGQRFGLIQFDTPMTTILLGDMYVDLPVPALAVLAPLIVVPVLFVIGSVMHSRRRRLGFC